MCLVFPPSSFACASKHADCGGDKYGKKYKMNPKKKENDATSEERRRKGKKNKEMVQNNRTC